jgi:Cof subfamily protein (haloacid dehalogenase superfamily)
VTASSISLVALDVDGTVLLPDGGIAPSTRAAVAAARSRSVRVVLASSRGPVALAPIQEFLGLADEWFIGFQGALVARWTGGADRDGGLEILTETRIPQATAAEVEAQALREAVSVGRYCGLRWRVPLVTEAIRAEAAQTGERPLLSTAEEAAADDPPHKIAAMALDDSQAPALRRLAAALPPAVTGTFSHPLFLEITAAGVDKATGLRALAEHLAVPVERRAAVGDGLNDLGLFAAVGRPIAMGQAQAEVRAAAGWVTTSNTDDGVARAMAHLGLAGAASN